jgi:hypothetical protein
MQMRLWQVFAIITWIAVTLAVASANWLSPPVRSGVAFLLVGAALTFGRAIFPRPPARTHIENDARLQRLSDLLILGGPAFVAFFVGFSLLTLNVLIGCLGSVLVLSVYVALRTAVTRDERR